MQPSVRQTVAALERLEMSEKVREGVGYPHTYPLRASDEETITRFYEAFGQLPPRGYWRSLWWHLRS